MNVIISKKERLSRRKLKEEAFMKITNNHIIKPSLNIKDVWTPIIQSEEMNNKLIDSI